MSLKVKINISRKSAIKRGTTQHGAQVVDLSDADLQSLSEQERDELAHADEEQGVLRLDVDPARNGVWVDSPGLAGAREALAKAVAVRAQAEKEKTAREAVAAEKRRKALAWALAAPLDQLVDDDIRNHFSHRHQFRVHADRDAVGDYGLEIPWDDPALSARRAEVKAEVARRNAEEVAAHERYLAQEEAAKAEAKAIKDRARQEFRAFALDGLAGEAAQRAAREDYDVTGAVLEAVQGQLPEAAAVSIPNDNYLWGERPSPKADAFALLDRITEAAKGATNKPACVSVEVSRVLRIEEPAEEDGEHGRKRTGVAVKISSPITEERHLLYYVE